MRRCLQVMLLLGFGISVSQLGQAMPSGGSSSSSSSSSQESSSSSSDAQPRKTEAAHSSRPKQASVTPSSTPRPSTPQVKSAEALQDPGADDLFLSGMSASDRGDFENAVLLFQQANSKRPDDPDTLNMLAHSLRKVGKTDEAIAIYHRAIQLRPQFPEAREYLGEAYVQAAMEQLQILETYGAEGNEGHEELEDAIKNAAANIH